jgi:N-acetylneuraminic acid mutarotase
MFAFSQLLRLRVLLIAGLIAATSSSVSQLASAQASGTNEWAWMGGTKTPQSAVYGTLGTFAVENMPGNRESAVSWTDSNGKLWLFGGDGFDSVGKDGYLNDLWEFDPSTNEWTWMGGSSTLSGTLIATGITGTLGTPAAGNIPAGREDAVSWTDVEGNIWLFGGDNYGSCQAIFNDLWKFSPATSEWAWMSGTSQDSTKMISGYCAVAGVYGVQGTAAAGNVPGSRENSHSWTDSHGNLWLFGGTGLDSAGSFGSLNDIWEFSPSTNEWTWMGGGSTVRQSGVYGTKGTPATGNIPGSRGGAVSWTDGSDNFWLFGGDGYDSAGNGGLLNDLWEYDPSTGKWAWMGGSSTYPASCTTPLTEECGAAGVYGTLQTPAVGNFPGARSGAVSWTDAKGNLWLFGGQGIDSAGTWGYLNDLWEFNPSTNEWAWMDGSSTLICASVYCGQPGVYGTLQTPAFGNSPSGRANAVSWTDSNSKLWLFGGQGVNITGVWNYFEDLWEFQPNTGGLSVAATPTFSPNTGTYTTSQLVTISDTTPRATIYYFINGISPAAVYTAPIPVSSSEYIEAYAVAGGFTNSSLATATYTMNIPVAAAPTFSPASGTYATAQTITISDATPGTTIYYTTDGTMPSANSAVYGTPITVSSSMIIQAIAVANNYLNSAIASTVYTIGPTSTLGEWAWMGGSSTVLSDSVYGQLGVPSSENFPGALNGSTRWTDQSGNLWLFGGGGIDSTGNNGYLNTLWKFNSSSNEWTWMGGSKTAGTPGVYGALGISATGNIPGSRGGAVSWTDGGGNFWLFGGYGYDAGVQLGELNDLWKFNPATMQWAWMGGSSKEVLSFYGSYGRPGVYGTLGTPAAGNIPGSRSGSASWVDSGGNFWLFGGIGQDAAGDSVTLNDIWEFNPATNQWAWMGGSNVLNPDVGSEPGVYGTLGVPAAENIPGSRSGAATWTDSSGNFWMFGGSDPFGSGGNSSPNDLWMFNPSSNQWTWMSGSNVTPCVDYAAESGLFGGYFCGQLSVNGALGVPAAGNVPGGRSPQANWIDSRGNLWLFGGTGLDVSGEFLGPINDLWYYNPSTNLWAWMGGNTQTNGCIFDGLDGMVCGGQTGVYGTAGTPAVGNIPGTRSGAVSWTDNAGNFWLFSGHGQGASFFSDVETYDLNDLWEYRPSTTTMPPAITPVFSIQSGSYSVGVGGGSLTISNGMANSSIYYTTNGNTPTAASTLYSGPLTISSSEIINAITIAPGYGDSAVASATYIISPPRLCHPFPLRKEPTLRYRR